MSPPRYRSTLALHSAPAPHHHRKHSSIPVPLSLSLPPSARSDTALRPLRSRSSLSRAPSTPRPHRPLPALAPHLPQHPYSHLGNSRDHPLAPEPLTHGPPCTPKTQPRHCSLSRARARSLSLIDAHLGQNAMMHTPRTQHRHPPPWPAQPARLRAARASRASSWPWPAGSAQIA